MKRHLHGWLLMTVLLLVGPACSVKLSRPVLTGPPMLSAHATFSHVPTAETKSIEELPSTSLLIFVESPNPDSEQWWRWFRPKRITPPIPPTGPTFYVRTDGGTAANCNGTVNVADSVPVRPNCAWNTIQKLATTLVDGDTGRVQAGTYAEAISPTVGGTLGSPITFVADGVVTFCTLTLGAGDDYLRWIGFVIDTDAGGCTKANRAVLVGTTTVTGVEFWHMTIRDANQTGIEANNVDTRFNNTIIIGNTFTDINSPGVAVGIGGEDPFVAYNSVTNVDPDIFFTYGNNGYWLNNYAEMKITPGRHGDVFQNDSSPVGFAFNLFEGNFLLGENVANDEHGVLWQDLNSATRCPSGCGDMNENLIRRNVWTNFRGGVGWTDSSTATGTRNTRVVHETFADIVLNTLSSPYSGIIRNNTAVPQGVNNGYFFNNIANDAWTPSITTNLQIFGVQNQPDAVWTAADYNLAYKTGGTVTFAANWTNQANEQSNVDPVFTNKAARDLTLQVTSGAIGNAGPLTVTSGSGTGTTFSVAAGGGGFFRGPNADIAQYGGKLTAGDVITVGTDTRTVVSISGDAITVDSSFTWADADPVYWGDDTTPDIGAYPYKASGYTLSATYSGSSTKTITPNDASLVRFVVCYSSGVPYEVDNSSPFTCSAPAGTFEARVYPRYATKPSTTLWAVATP